MQTTKLKIKGMTCPKCAGHVQKALKSVPGVADASVQLPDKAVVRHNDASLDQLKRAVAAAGEYSADLDA